MPFRARASFYREEDPHAQRVRALRRSFARHNRLVFLVALLTLCVAAALWFVVYALLYWIAVLFTASTRGMDAQPPDILPALFIYSGALLVLLTWLANCRRTNDLPRDEQTLLTIAADLLLAIPRATIAVWANLSAWQSLTEPELHLAAELLARLERERRIPLHQLPLEIPGESARMNILLALQLTDQLRVYRSGGETWLACVPKSALVPTDS